MCEKINRKKWGCFHYEREGISKNSKKRKTSDEKSCSDGEGRLIFVKESKEKLINFKKW